MKQNSVSDLFLISDLSGKLIGNFKEVFLGIYFLTITQGNIVSVSIYYIVFFLVYVICLLLVNKLQKMNLMTMFRIGIFLNLMQCLILLIAGSKITDFIICFAIFASIGNAFYYYPEQILIKRVNKENGFRNYVMKDKILGYAVKIILPIMLGYLISKNSYGLAFAILSLLIFICFCFSFFVKEFELGHDKINLRSFFKHINKNGNSKLLKLLSIRILCRGLSSFSAISTLLTIMTFMVVEKEFSLGSITSIMTIVSIFTVYVVTNFIKRKNLSKLYIPISIIQSIIVIILAFSITNLNISSSLNIGTFTISVSFILILLYNLINSISNPIFETSNTIVSYECMEKQDIKTGNEPNYIFWFEIMINSSRSFGYLILIFISSIGFDLTIISFLLVLFSFMYIVFAYILKVIEQKYLIK